MSTRRKRKQKLMSKEEYIRTFCQEKRIRNRRAVYVSPETHRNLLNMAYVFFVFKDHYVTAMSLADAILSHHFEANKEMLNGVSREEQDRFFEHLTKKGSEMEEEDDYDDDPLPD